MAWPGCWRSSLLKIKIGDLTVHRLGFGAMRVCGPNVWGAPRDRAHALRVLRRAYELGCNFFDTAWAYGEGHSERLLGQLVRGQPGQTDRKSVV